MSSIIKRGYGKVKRLYIKLRCKLSPEYAYWNRVNTWYFNWVQKDMNYKNPKNITEKLMWLTRYWQDPRKSECADKYRVREYIKNSGLEDILLPIYGVWEDANEIDFDKLPNQFVLKCNHGCGYNIICKNKADLDRKATVVQLNSWMKEDFGTLFYEIHYSKIKPLIFCEQFMPSLECSVVDYKIHCINGEPYCFLICSERDNDNNRLSLSSYSLQWERLDYLKNETEKTIPKPLNLERMVEVARILSKPFPYVRVDLYEVEGKLYFGEMTFTPQGNVMDYYKDEVLMEMGNRLVLPEKYKE